MQYEILLYYKYVWIEDPEKEKKRQIEICKKLGLKGRIIVAREGINGTVEGLKENTQKYINEMSKDKKFADVNWKRSEGDACRMPRG